MTEYGTVEDFYKGMKDDIENKFYKVPDEDIIQKITPLFNQIKQKRKQKDQLKNFIERYEKLLENTKIPSHIKISIESGKNKLIESLKECIETLVKIEKEEYANVVFLTNVLMFDKIKDCDKFNQEKNVTEGLSDILTDLEYWIRFEQWDYVEQCANKLNGEERTISSFFIPSPLEIYYNYCRIS